MGLGTQLDTNDIYANCMYINCSKCCCGCCWYSILLSVHPGHICLTRLWELESISKAGQLLGFSTWHVYWSATGTEVWRHRYSSKMNSISLLLMFNSKSIHNSCHWYYLFFFFIYLTHFFLFSSSSHCPPLSSISTYSFHLPCIYLVISSCWL